MGNMRPSVAPCAWCGARGIAFVALPGSFCHDCGRHWRVRFWEDMTDFEVRAACKRLGRTPAQVFGQPKRPPFRNIIRDAVRDTLEDMRRVVDRYILARVTLDVIAQIEALDTASRVTIQRKR